jgi:hypothetical protein
MSSSLENVDSTRKKTPNTITNSINASGFEFGINRTSSHSKQEQQQQQSQSTDIQLSERGTVEENNKITKKMSDDDADTQQILQVNSRKDEHLFTGGDVGGVNSAMTGNYGSAGLNDSQTVVEDVKTFKSLKSKEIVLISILFFINLINYIDRFTVAGN